MQADFLQKSLFPLSAPLPHLREKDNGTKLPRLFRWDVVTEYFRASSDIGDVLWSTLLKHSWHFVSAAGLKAALSCCWMMPHNTCSFTAVHVKLVDVLSVGFAMFGEEISMFFSTFSDISFSVGLLHAALQQVTWQTSLLTPNYKPYWIRAVHWLELISTLCISQVKKVTYLQYLFFELCLKVICFDSVRGAKKCCVWKGHKGWSGWVLGSRNKQKWSRRVSHVLKSWRSSLWS